MSHTAIIVDTAHLLDMCLADITCRISPKLAVDLEGVELSRNGRICILQIHVKSSTLVWLIDITMLGRYAFEHQNANKWSLKRVLEDDQIVKLFYDVRNDADALFNLYRVDVRNTFDVQLLEVAARRANKNYTPVVTGLSKAIEQYLPLLPEWSRAKEEGRALFDPKQGGSYEVFEKRPLDPRLVLYCAQDVSILFLLETTLENRIVESRSLSLNNWKKRVSKASAKRAEEAHSATYEAKGRHRIRAPKF